MNLSKKYWNNQKYCECQLVSLYNAAIFHELKVPERYGKQYKKDCKKSHCINGGCINTEEVRERLKLKCQPRLLKITRIKKYLPLEFSIHCYRGYHSVLAVDYDEKTNKIAVTNLIRNRITWIKLNKLKKMQNKWVKLRQWKKQ